MKILDIESLTRLIQHHGFDQSFIEVKIQRLDKNKALQLANTEIYELINGTKVGHESDGKVLL